MNPNRSRQRRVAAGVLVLLVLPGAVHGCSSPTSPAPPPSGGQQLNLSYAEFDTTVAPMLTRLGCDAGGDCHGAGIRGTLELSPIGAKDSQFDFNQVKLQVSVTAPDASPILTEPLALAAGGTPHGLKPFASTADSDYITIRTWIHHGVTQ